MLRLARFAGFVVAWLLLSAAPALALDPSRRITQYLLDAWSVRDGAPAGTITAIAQTPDGYLWLGTSDGLVRFDGLRFEAVTKLDDVLGRSHAYVNALLVGREGSLWVGTNAGLVRLVAGQLTLSLNSAVCGLAESPSATVWATLCWEGLAWIREGRVSRLYLGGWWTALACDSFGNVWANGDQGLLRATESAIVRFASNPGDSPSTAGLLQAGADDVALLRRDALGTVHAIRANQDGDVWVSTRAGLIGFRAGRVTARITARDGLSSDDVSLAFEDRDGNFWVGTVANGLNLRRGAGYEALTRASGLSHDSVTAIYEDREGNLWVGAQRGLNRIKQGIFTAWGTAEGLAGNRTAAVLESRDGAIWTWSDGGGLTEIRDGRTRVYTIRDGLATNFGGPLYESRDGSLWIGHDRGVSRFKDGRATAFRQGELASRYVGGITEDAEGMVFSVWGIGCRRWNGHALQPLPPAVSSALGSGEAFMVLRTRDGSQWFATTDGAVVVRGGTARVVYRDEQEPHDSVSSAFEDSEGVVWLTTLRHGVMYVGEDRVVPIASAEGLCDDFIWSMAEDRSGYFWMGSLHGIFRVRRRGLLEFAAGQRQRVECEAFGLADGMRSIQAMGAQPGACRARDGRLWFVTSEGLVVVDPERMPRNALPPPVALESVVANGVSLPSTTDVRVASGSSRLEFRYSGLSLVAPEKVRFKYRLDGYDRDWLDAGAQRVAQYMNLRPGAYTFRVRACNNDGIWNEAGLAVPIRVLPRWHETLLFRVSAPLLLGLVLVAGVVWRVRHLEAQRRWLEGCVADRTRELQELNGELDQRVKARTSELEEQKERLAVTLRSIGEAVIATDTQGCIVLLNRAAERLTGWALAEAIGRPVGEVLPLRDPVSRRPLPDPVAGVIDGQSPWGEPAQALLQRRDGSELLVADSVAPIRDSQSRTIGIVFVFRDITERQRMLEQLENAEKLEAIGVLAGGIAHDFNNLLTGVFGYIELASHRCRSRLEVLAPLEKAMAALTKARGLTGQLLTFSRGGEPVSAPLLIDELLNKCVEFALSGSNVRCVVHVAPDLWPCQGDERQINQVIDNLLLNARQAMPQGGRIDLTAENAAVTATPDLSIEPGRFVRLLVRDEGPGIPPELQARIFEPFFTTKPTGTGLGLAICRSIIHKHRGHIAVQSEPGRGTTFELLLPASDEAPSERKDPAGAAHAGEGRVLVMDDEKLVREVAREMLEEIGYRTEVAAGANEAVSAFERARAEGRPFGAVLLDLTVPGGAGGLVVLSRLRAIDPGVRAIASSGYSGDPVMARPEEHGFAAQLTKPFTVADLAEVIGRVLAPRASV